MKIEGRNYSFYSIVINFFTVDECNEVIKKCNSMKMTGVKVALPEFTEYWKGDSNRFIQKVELTRDQIRRINIAIDNFNYQTYKFALHNELLNFVARYDKPEHHIDWHRDDYETLEHLYTDIPATRITMTLGLNNKYKGGGFDLKENGLIPLNTGDAVFFCSQEFHRATPIKEGVRYSLTSWRLGRRK